MTSVTPPSISGHRSACHSDGLVARPMPRDDLYVAFARSEERGDELADRDVRLVIDRRCGRTNDEPPCPLPADLIAMGSWDHADLDFERGGVGADHASV
jgi:hypothetical protein